MIRVLIVDDEPPAHRKVRRFLQNDLEIGEIHEAGSGEEAIAAIETWRPDLVFLDIEMPDMDGFRALSSVTRARDFQVIFLTAHADHALRGFDVEALDYLIKPVDPSRFERALERAKERLATRANACSQPEQSHQFLKRLLVETNSREFFLPIDQIEYCASDRNYIHVYAGAHTYVIRGPIESLAQRLDPEQFVRISRSELVNLDFVKEMQPWFHGERRMVLKNGRELMWTRRFRARTKSHISRDLAR